MDTFYLVTEVATYQRRYVLKNPPDQPSKIDSCAMAGLVGSSSSVELPEGYRLVGPLKEIKYESKPIDLNNLDDVTKRCVSCLTSLDDPIPVKKTKTKFINDGTMNKDKVYREKPVEKSEQEVKAKSKRLKTINWAELKIG